MPVQEAVLLLALARAKPVGITKQSHFGLAASPT